MVLLTNKVLSKSFFVKPTLKVANDLLGKYLIRKIGKKEIACKIIEVEAYDGPKDKASHASNGKTTRNKIMFEEGGCFYIYLVYGMHYMLNVVTGEKNYPEAVLIRGIECNGKIISGPAKLTKFLKIDKKSNSKKAEKKTNLWFEDRGEKLNKKHIIRTPRIGVDYAGPIWSKKLYRFLVK